MTHKQIFTAVFLFSLAACTDGNKPRKTTEIDAGPITARALNKMAKEKPESLVRIAFALEKASNFSEALRVYQQAKVAKPSLVRADIGIVRIHIHHGKISQAKEILRPYLSKSSLPSGLKGEIAKLYLDMAEYDLALEIIGPVTDEMAGRTITMVGILYELKGKGVQARLMFDKARAKGDGKAKGFAKLMAYSFALDGAYKTAVAILQPVLNNANTVKEGRLALAYVYAVSGQEEPAKKLMESVHGFEYMQKRITLIRLIPLMDRREKTEALIFERIRPETVKRLLPMLKKMK